MFKKIFELPQRIGEERERKAALRRKADEDRIAAEKRTKDEVATLNATIKGLVAVSEKSEPGRTRKTNTFDSYNHYTDGRPTERRPIAGTRVHSVSKTDGRTKFSARTTFGSDMALVESRSPHHTSIRVADNQEIIIEDAPRHLGHQGKIVSFRTFQQRQNGTMVDSSKPSTTLEDKSGWNGRGYDTSDLIHAGTKIPRFLVTATGEIMLGTFLPNGLLHADHFVSEENYSPEECAAISRKLMSRYGDFVGEVLKYDQWEAN